MLNPTTLNTPLSNPQLISDMPETFHSTSHIAHQCNPHHDKPHCTAMVHLTHHNAELRRCSHHSCCHHIALKCRLHIPLTLHAAPKTIAGHRLQHNTCVYTDSQLTNTARFYIYTHKQHTKTAQEYLYRYRKHVLWLMYLDTTVKVEGGEGMTNETMRSRLSKWQWLLMPDCQNSEKEKHQRWIQNPSIKIKIRTDRGGSLKLKTNQLNRQNITNSACMKQGQDLKFKKKEKKKVQGHQLHTMPMMLIMQGEGGEKSQRSRSYTSTHMSHAPRESNPMRTKVSNKLHE